MGQVLWGIAAVAGFAALMGGVSRLILAASGGGTFEVPEADMARNPYEASMVWMAKLLRPGLAVALVAAAMTIIVGA